MNELYFLNKKLPSLTSEQLKKFDDILAKDPAKGVAEFIQYAAAEKRPNSSEFLQKYESTYELIFEYAISKNKHSFLNNIPYKSILECLNWDEILSYAETQGHDFYAARVSEMANCRSSNQEVYFRVGTFKKAADAIFSSLATEFDSALVRTILLSPNIPERTQLLYVYIWVDCLCDYVSTNQADVVNSNLPHIQNSLFSYSNKNHHLEILKSLLQASEFSIYNPNIYTSLLDNYEFDPPQIISLFGEKGFALPSVLLKRLMNQLASSNPKQSSWSRQILADSRGSLTNNNPYRKYQLVAELLSLVPSQHYEFIIEHQELFLTDKISEKFVSHLINFVNNETKKSLIKYYISHPEFNYGDQFTDAIFNLDESELLEDYLKTPHTLLGKNKFGKGWFQHLIKWPKLIPLLLARKDYDIREQEKVFAHLLELLRNNDQKSIALVLQHPKVIALLKKFYSERGADQLSCLDREVFMPWVIACYLSSPSTIPIGRELFFSFESADRDMLLKGFLPTAIDPTHSTLRQYCIKIGDQELIAGIGGVDARLVRTGPTIFAPSSMKDPLFNAALRIFQRKLANKSAEAILDKSFTATEIAEPIQEQAKQIAEHYVNEPLVWQHQTTVQNVEKILSMDNRLRSRRHLIGHSIFGKASQGLISGTSNLGAESAFAYFIRISGVDDNSTKVTGFSNLNTSEEGRFVLNGMQVLRDNPHIQFLKIASYPSISSKTLAISDDISLKSGTLGFADLGLKIDLSNPEERPLKIYQALFELILTCFIEPLDEPLRSELKERLMHPQGQEDFKLAKDLLDLLSLQWLLPGSVPLKFSYVEQIDYGSKTYPLSELRDIVTQGSEDEVLHAIRQFTDIELFPFVITGIISIAQDRGHKQVVKELSKTKLQTHQHDHVVYYPNELYECESLVQLVLEDLTNQRVYVHKTKDTVSIQSTLRSFSNRGGAHHAEMAILHYALGIGDYVGQNAFSIILPDTLSLTLGENGNFTTLDSMRDALLSFELTTLLVCRQNLDYYVQHGGQFHPVTGKGASNGQVALQADKLFTDDHQAFHISVVYKTDIQQFELKTTGPNTAALIASRIEKVLGLKPANVSLVDDTTLRINVRPANLIAKLRQNAICYEGINILTEDGRLLLANRHGKGLASAGGHHSDKYNRCGIAYGLRSEFGFEFKEPEKLEQSVVLMQLVEKTGIYVVSANDLKGTFRADLDEFDKDSEVALTLTEMRGRQFYEVMPLAELCQYQLNLLKDYIKTEFPDLELDLSINQDVEIQSDENMSYKVPSAKFGRILITIRDSLPDELKRFGELALSQGSSNSIELDVSPLVLLKGIKDARESASHTSAPG